MKLKIKETYLILLIVISLISLGVYSTYALFTASTTIEDAVGISTTLDIGKSISEYEIVSISPGDSKIIELNITNSSSNTIYYGAWYKVAEGNQEDINIGLYTSDEENSNSSSGTLSSSSSIKLLVGIANNSNTTITIYLGVKGSTTNELNLSSDKHLITGTFASEYTVNLNVVNGTSDVSSVGVKSGNNAVFHITANDTYGLYIDSDTCNGTLNSKTGVYRVENITEDKTCTLTLRKPNASDTLTLLGLTPSEGTPDFSKSSCTEGCDESTVGIYSAQDDLGTSYYFRGDVENNYVYFAGFYWRIIRINGDGTVRIIYDGTRAHENGELSTDRQIGTSSFTPSATDNAYAGYMYGSASASEYNKTHANNTGSIIKGNIDTWYEEKIINNGFSSYVADAIYCNDRSVIGGTGIGTTTTTYTAYTRLLSINPAPTLKCKQDNDKFTVNTSLGNGKLNNPIGLITADEVAMAGTNYYSSYTNTYLKNDSYFWTMTPFEFSESLKMNIGLVNSDGGFNIDATNLLYRIKPVISLKANALNNGSGTINNPFRINEILKSPDLVDGLIPVMYYNNEWVVADSTNEDDTYKWYDYDNKVWANAVLVTNAKRNSLTKDLDGNYTIGQTIGDSYDEGTIAFYVWIPRYKYKVWNINKEVGTDSYNAQTVGIDIVFENGTSSTGTISCSYNYNVDSNNGGINLSTTTAENCTGDNGDYYTHPAFTFDSDELRGFWIGKYEVSTGISSEEYGGGIANDFQVRILPNVASWRYNYLSNFNTAIQNMQTENNIYGLSTSRTNTDSHMLTNYEWGAVAYLTNSRYGRCSDGTCSEVTINNCSDYITGIGADSESAESSYTTCTSDVNKYNGEKGVLASTTGNVYGVYDMSGGAYEYVMGNMSSIVGSYEFNSSSSNFDSSWYTSTTLKYLTRYSYGTSFNNQIAYNRSRLGDATGEVILSTGGTGGWYDDHTYFPYSSNAWFGRGGSCFDNSSAGLFNIYNTNGSFYAGSSTRAALVKISS